jgi:hypothetical protein
MAVTSLTLTLDQCWGALAAVIGERVTYPGKDVSYRNVGPWQLASSASLTPEQWNHVATTYDGRTLCIYINGQLDGQLAFTSQPGFPTLNTLLGARFNQGVVADFFFHKAECWKYEEEVRLILDRQGIVNFRPESLKEVILGCRTYPAVREFARSNLAYQTVELSQMSEIATRFGLAQHTVKSDVFVATSHF